ncbi:hypothetical protein GQ44DRAFT_607931 [Phaeosphaeriaceae sp. PMI808]|nr:hypothetical protein GQ44DRAFT_607931 [Phaeosphaeriaceae sp. PMI808]
MPGIYAPSPSHAQTTSREFYVDATPRFSFATETSDCQVMDPGAHETRKRSRGGFTSQRLTTSEWNNNSPGFSRFTDTKSPPPLAHDRYQLADGGMERSHPFRRQTGDYDDYFQLQNQRGQWSVPPTPHTGANRLAVNRPEALPNEVKSWSILGLVGGVAGKLFHFCTVPFRGFQAGGGQRFTIDSHEEIAARLGFQDHLFLHQVASPVQQTTPGGFPQDDYGVKSVESIENENCGRPRMTKRLRTADNWVVVGDNGETESRPSTPRLSERRVPHQPISPSQIPRPSSRANMTTPSIKRPSLIPVSRRSTMDRRSIHGSSKALSSPHGRQRSHNRINFGSPATTDDKAKKPASPLPKESQRLINKVRREEMEEDARMRRMSSQMSAMLREAKEALGSKFEIEDEYEDGGNYHDEGMDQSDCFPRFS